MAKAAEILLRELSSDDADVRTQFWKRYEQHARHFAEAMAYAFENWRQLDAMVGKDERRAYVSGLAYTAIQLSVLSMKLLLSGHAVAAGNMYRQVVETMALALLCSVGNKLHVLDAFLAEKYSSNGAVSDMLKHAQKLGLNDGAAVLKEVQTFNHKYSHPTFMTLAHALESRDGGALYVGVSFDVGKIRGYDTEVRSRCSCADVFSNFIDGVKANLAKWDDGKSK